MKCTVFYADASRISTCYFFYFFHMTFRLSYINTDNKFICKYLAVVFILNLSGLESIIAYVLSPVSEKVIVFPEIVY